MPIDGTGADFYHADSWLFLGAIVIYAGVAVIHEIMYYVSRFGYYDMSHRKTHYWNSLAALFIIFGTMYVAYSRSSTHAQQYAGLFSYALGYAQLIYYPAVRLYMPGGSTVSPGHVMAGFILAACETVVANAEPLWLFVLGLIFVTYLHFRVYLFIFLEETTIPRYNWIMRCLFTANVVVTTVMITLIWDNRLPGIGFLANAILQAVTSFVESLPQPMVDEIECKSLGATDPSLHCDISPVTSELMDVEMGMKTDSSRKRRRRHVVGYVS